MSKGSRTRGLGARHEERRRQIAEALLAIIDLHGLDAVSLRDVAARAEVSLGAVQHYFRSKDEMLLFALDYISERGTERVRRSLGQGEQPPRAVLRDILAELVPADDQRRAELRIATAFTARSLVSPKLADHLRAGYDSLYDVLVLLIRHAQEADEMPAGLDPERTAAALFALAEGLGMQVLIGHRNPRTALAILDEHLDRLSTTAS
ncbi:TetR/AcrR family transcriptional regulator [Spongiactinospora gelatinilytica]|uniref:TetR/AcrR family transcriptional regulator n=1 Tax=Spongiactinospora gelatinilytica TaxID=2666298 RepID=UPI0018F73756|nr:TetR/AcrR family transcriptional regulator [Spongiactinospora gelatinilytica]